MMSERQEVRSMIDFHTHILPGVDDGSRSVEESLEMLRREAEQGVTHVVATPHFYANHNNPRAFLEARREAEEKLRQAIAGDAALPALSIGAEVHFFEGMSDADCLQDMAIGRYLLVEMPQGGWTDRQLHELTGIYQKRGLVPVIAHLDRYLNPLQGHQQIARLSRLPIPVLFQFNASFFSGISGRQAVHLFARGVVHLLGSDCHDLRTRVPNMQKALAVVERRLGVAAIERFAADQQALLADLHRF